MSAIMGRPTIFKGKESRYRRQGIMTKEGSARFEVARATLAGMVGWPIDKVSDGDVFEFLARGPLATKAYLKQAGLAK